MELIPAIDLLGGQVVRLARGDYERVTVYGTDPAAAARRWAGEGAQRLHVVDLDAAFGQAPQEAAVAAILMFVAVAVSLHAQTAPQRAQPIKAGEVPPGGSKGCCSLFDDHAKRQAGVLRSGLGWREVVCSCLACVVVVVPVIGDHCFR